jgi:hypothetical protein
MRRTVWPYLKFLRNNFYATLAGSLSKLATELELFLRLHFSIVTVRMCSDHPSRITFVGRLSSLSPANVACLK